MHGGSNNHGCEAIVRSTAALYPDKKIILLSSRPKQDLTFGLDKIVEIVGTGETFANKSRLHHLIAWLFRKITRSNFLYYKGFNKNLKSFLKKIDYAFSIGGDNYFYTINDLLEYQNEYFNKHKIKTVLWGCSIDEEVINKRVLKDLKKYHLITARESYTFKTLKGLHLDNVVRTIDSAFFLDIKKIDLSEDPFKKPTIGINVSPLIMKYANADNIVLKNYQLLIDWILKNTGDNILLIPHVMISGNDDSETSQLLKSYFKDEKRIFSLENSHELDCLELKYLIGKCEFLIAARTHASIAAYSQFVPTLVLGYSVKSRGIAKDLFDNKSGYVVSTQQLTKNDELLNAFLPLFYKRASIRRLLIKRMPTYLQDIYLIK